MFTEPTASTLPAEDNTAIVAAAQEILETSLAERDVLKEARIAALKAMRSTYYTFPETDEIMLGLESLLDLGTVVTKRNTPARALTLVGDSGSGKTSLLRQWQYKNRPLDVQVGDLLVKFHKILYVEVPVRCTLKGLSEALLLAMGEPEGLAMKGTDRALAQRAAKRLESLGVQVVILDEFQHLVSKQNRRINYNVVDYVKGQLNHGHTSFVLAGTKDAARIFEDNDQLEHRSAGHYVFEPVDENDEAAFRNFKGMLARFAKKSPVPFKAKMLNGAFALRVCRMAKGHRGRAIDFMFALVTRAIMKHCAEITPELAVEVADLKRSLSDPDWRNPFLQLVVEAKATPEKDTSELTGLSVRERQLSQDDLLHPQP